MLTTFLLQAKGFCGNSHLEEVLNSRDKCLGTYNFTDLSLVYASYLLSQTVFGELFPRRIVRSMCVAPNSSHALLKYFGLYLEPLIPLFDSGLVVRCVGFEEVHVLFSKFVFTNEAAHSDS